MSAVRKITIFAAVGAAFAAMIRFFRHRRDETFDEVTKAA